MQNARIRLYIEGKTVSSKSVTVEKLEIRVRFFLKYFQSDPSNTRVCIRPTDFQREVSE